MNSKYWWGGEVGEGGVVVVAEVAAAAAAAGSSRLLFPYHLLTKTIRKLLLRAQDPPGSFFLTIY